MKEVWEDIKAYEGSHQISNLGRVRSLERRIFRSDGQTRLLKNKMLSLSLNKTGYLKITINKNSVLKTHIIHHLVWDHFGHKERDRHRIQIDHINENKTDNRIENLQLLTNRENCSKGYKNKLTTSKYTGVSYYKRTDKWHARIYHQGIKIHLGFFDLEIDAAQAYKNALIKITSIIKT